MEQMTVKGDWWTCRTALLCASFAFFFFFVALLAFVVVQRHVCRFVLVDRSPSTQSKHTDA